MQKTRLGTHIKIKTPGESYRAYIPALLPFRPGLAMESLQPKLEEAYYALGKLDAFNDLVPNSSLLLYFYIRKEALLSSQIEGTQSSFDDLLKYENEEMHGLLEKDVEEVSHYVSAIQYGLKRLKEGFPLSLRLIKEIHALLLQGGRGSKKQPGEFRSSQNWIGGTRPGNAIFVPMPPDKLIEYMGNLEFYLNDKYGKFPTLIKAAISHVQFETIHPFLDGNGRTGRLLITLLLCTEGILKQPLLYLSLYFKKNRKVYYDMLTRVREDKKGWEIWIEFFLDGIIETAKEVSENILQINKLFEQDKAKIEKLKRAAPSALKVFEYLQQKAYTTIPKLAAALNISQPTATASLIHLIKFGIIREVSGKKRERLFAYKAYLDILAQDTDPLV